MPPYVLVVPITRRQLEREEHGRVDDPGERCRIVREMYRGDTFRLLGEVVDRATSQPVDITGWTIRYTAKYALQNADARAAMAQDNQGVGGVALVAPTMGQLLVTVQPIVTRGYPDGPVRLEYDVQATDPMGVVTTIETGEVVVRPDVTRAIT